jgi:outer membrane protein assembly factor BamB
MVHITRHLVVVWALAACFVQFACADDWRGFRGPGGQGASSETDLPTTWGEKENLAWKAELPGYGASSPITLGENIYLTCYSGYGTKGDGAIDELKLHVICLSRSDGKTVWDTQVAPKQPVSERVRDHGYAAPTPTTDGEHLFIFFGKTGVLKFDLDGKQIWQADVGSQTHGWGCGTSPVLYKDLVVVNASVESGSLVALNKKDGSEAWRAAGMNSSWNTPHLVTLANGDQELVVNIKGSILGFNPSTGEKLWTCQGIADYICPSVISEKGVVYAIGGRTSRAIAVRAGGRGDVTETHQLWEAKAGANVSSPVIHDGHMYWVSDRNRVAYCVRLEDGEIVYSERFKGQPYASTLVADDKLYVVTRYDGVFVLSAKPEFEQLAHNEFDDDSTFNASPIASNGKLFVRSDRFLYCIGK